MKNDIWIVLRDADWNLRPKAYMEKPENHDYAKRPPMNDGDDFVKIRMVVLDEANS